MDYQKELTISAYRVRVLQCFLLSSLFCAQFFLAQIRPLDYTLRESLYFVNVSRLIRVVLALMMAINPESFKIKMFIIIRFGLIRFQK